MDFVMVNDCQELNAAQLDLVLKCRAPGGRMVFVDDSHQCQPPGTFVRLQDGSEIPIEQLQRGNRVVTFDRRSAAFVKNGVISEIASRHYTGPLFTISAGEYATRCTESHKWLVRWTGKGHDAWITYLMRQGGKYRVGQTKLFLASRVDKRGNFDFGLASRARQERADAAWILRVHSTFGEALAYEQVLSARYGLPQVVFFSQPCNIHYSQDVIDNIYGQLEPQEDQALRCLRARLGTITYNLDYELSN